MGSLQMQSSDPVSLVSLQEEKKEIQGGGCHVRTETQEEGQVSAEAETDVKQPQAKECPG